MIRRKMFEIIVVDLIRSRCNEDRVDHLHFARGMKDEGGTVLGSIPSGSASCVVTWSAAEQIQWMEWAFFRECSGPFASDYFRFFPTITWFLLPFDEILPQNNSIEEIFTNATYLMLANRYVWKRDQWECLGAEDVESDADTWDHSLFSTYLGNEQRFAGIPRVHTLEDYPSVPLKRTLNLVEAHWVLVVEFCTEMSSGLTYIGSTVKSSMKSINHKVHLTLKANGDLNSSRCSCEVG